MKSIVFSMLIIVFLMISSIYSLHFKNVQGPPSEFPLHKIPQPMTAAVNSEFASVPGTFKKQGQKYVYETTIPVDAQRIIEGEETPIFRLSIVSVMVPQKDMKYFVKSPAGQFKEVTAEGIKSGFGLSTQSSIPAITFTFKNPKHGAWEVKVESTTKPPSHSKKTTDLHLLLENDSKYKIMSYLTTYHLTEGETVGLVTRVYDDEAFNRKKTVLKQRMGASFEESMIKPDAISPKEAPMEIVDIDCIYPDGTQKTIHMKDDGQNKDEGVNDNVFGGNFVADQSGKYYATVVARGKTPEGEPFLRTTHHMFTVVDENLEILDKAEAHYDEKRGMLDVEVSVVSDSLEKKLNSGRLTVNEDGMINLKFKAYAELFALTKKSEIPVAFTSGMTFLSKTSSGNYKFKLRLSTKWMVRAGIVNVVKDIRFKLKNVYVQDVSVSVPLAQVDEISLDICDKCRSKIYNHFTTSHPLMSFNGLLSEDMLMGPRPDFFVKNSTRVKASGHKLVLSHGYCADGSPFPKEDFDQLNDVVLFHDPNQNLNNDEFATRLGAFTESFDSFSIVAHSQGGLASLHLLSYYWSGFDMNEDSDPNSRIIQSVGSPYMGTAIAGWGDVGKALNVACGTNQDLTRDGAKLWLSGIPEAARKHVFYYTTSYKDWGYCNLVSQTVLSWPNDGATELKNANLPGGHNMGNTKKQCHADGMNYPNQCKDKSRNAEMSAKAAK